MDHLKKNAPTAPQTLMNEKNKKILELEKEINELELMMAIRNEMYDEKTLFSDFKQKTQRDIYVRRQIRLEQDKENTIKMEVQRLKGKNKDVSHFWSEFLCKPYHLLKKYRKEHVSLKSDLKLLKGQLKEWKTLHNRYFQLKNERASMIGAFEKQLNEFMDYQQCLNEAKVRLERFQSTEPSLENVQI